MLSVLALQLRATRAGFADMLPARLAGALGGVLSVGGGEEEAAAEEAAAVAEAEEERGGGGAAPKPTWTVAPADETLRVVIQIP